MEIIRVPKGEKDATVARLSLTKSASGRVQAMLKVQGPASAFMEHGEYETVDLAERAAVTTAERYRAGVLFIEDHT